jgi:23S rRNA (pseudouridine1915-N3)-methyltransferase
MSKIEIIAAGQLKKGPLYELCKEYVKRLRWPVKIIEVEGRDENREIEKLLKENAYVIAMDERGKTLASADFTKKLEKLRQDGTPVQFVIGGADGLSKSIRSRADLILCFGMQTWPHMLARVMLLEQIYRAQQISNGHPYHRE